ncbi:MAG TPA: hypothetical protein DGP25_02885 [Brevundimonas sp.]|nr:hypothetical protein [Brevundimonas sp.]
MAGYLRRLVEADLAGRHDYMLRLLGHRLSLMSVQVGALARREFDDAEYQRLRSMEVTMGASMFGPLPPRHMTSTSQTWMTNGLMLFRPFSTRSKRTL